MAALQQPRDEPNLGCSSGIKQLQESCFHGWRKANRLSGGCSDTERAFTILTECLGKNNDRHIQIEIYKKKHSNYKLQEK